MNELDSATGKDVKIVMVGCATYEVWFNQTPFFFTLSSQKIYHIIRELSESAQYSVYWWKCELDDLAIDLPGLGQSRIAHSSILFFSFFGWGIWMIGWKRVHWNPWGSTTRHSRSRFSSNLSQVSSRGAIEIIYSPGNSKKAYIFWSDTFQSLREGIYEFGLKKVVDDERER